MKKLKVYQKLLLALFVIFAGVFAVFRYATADSLKVVITGNMLTDGTWKVGSQPEIWSASAFDGDNEAGTAEELNADSVIKYDGK